MPSQRERGAGRADLSALTTRAGPAVPGSAPRSRAPPHYPGLRPTVPGSAPLSQAPPRRPGLRPAVHVETRRDGGCSAPHGRRWPTRTSSVQHDTIDHRDQPAGTGHPWASPAGETGRTHGQHGAHVPQQRATPGGRHDRVCVRWPQPSLSGTDRPSLSSAVRGHSGIKLEPGCKENAGNFTNTRRLDAMLINP